MNDAAPPPRRSNRRLTARRACRLTVKYRGEQGWRAATAMDLSIQGCRLRVGEDLPRGAPITVGFEGSPGPGLALLEVEIPGTVIWSRFEGLSYQAGVQFREMPDGLNEIMIALS